jgi:hypothetical protein
VGVVEHHDHQPVRRERPDAASDGVVEREPEGLAGAALGTGVIPWGRCQLGEQAGEQRHVVGRQVPQGGAAVGGEEAAQHLHPGPERRGAVALEAPAPCDRRTPGRGPGAQRLGQAGLADARLTGDEHRAAPARRGGDHRRLEPGELLVTPDDEHLARRCALLDHRRRARGAPVEAGVLEEDLLLERLQRGLGLGADLCPEDRTALGVGPERVGLTAGAVERQHELRPQVAPERVVGHERGQDGGDLGVAAAGQLRLGPDLRAAGAQLVEALHLRCGEGLVAEVTEDRSAPPRPGVVGEGGRLLVASAVQRRLRVGEEPLEHRGVHVEVVDHQPVATPPR